MSRPVRAWLGVALAALLAAATLHLLTLLGVGAVWGAMVHLTLFGWITALIIAMSYHTLPNFSGRELPFPQLVWLHAVVFCCGVVLAISGLFLGAPLEHAGLALETAAALLFVLNIALLLIRGRRREGCSVRPPLPDIDRVDRAGRLATIGAGLCLPVALGLLLAGRAGWLGGEWALAAEHLGALGWVMLMIVGVALHVLPRFSGRAVLGFGWVRAQLICHLTALLLIVPALGVGHTSIFAAGGVLMAVATALFAWAIWPTLVPAARPASDLRPRTAREAPR
jgi:hypothetical protein